MYSLKDAAAGLFVSAAIGAGMLCTGKLLARAIEVPDPAGVTRSSWQLFGRVHYRMFEPQRCGVPMQHSSAVICARGIKHLVVCQRLGAWEHRFVIQLLGPTMREFIAQGRQLGVQLLLQDNLTLGFAPAGAPANWSAGIGLQDVGRVPTRADEALLALLEVASLCLARQPEELTASPLVQDVCVSLVLAPEYEALAASQARRFEKATAG